MKLLAFDTSGAACSVALQNGKAIWQHHVLAPMQQAKLLLPFIDELLKQAKIALNQLDAIAFGCGPGSFTGVRLAVSVAQGLGFATGVPLIPLSSLQIMAQTAYDKRGCKKMLVAVDARMNEAYWAKYAIQKNLAFLVDEEHVTQPKAVLCDEANWVGVGNAWDVYADHIAYKCVEIAPDQLPEARSMLALAENRLTESTVQSAFEIKPVYLRDKVAYKTAERLAKNG